MKDIDSLTYLDRPSFSMAFEHAPVGMGVSTPDGRILEVNQAFLDMLGYSREEFTARDSTHFTHGDDVGRTREFLHVLQGAGSGSEVLEKRYIKRDGGIIWARVAVTLRRDERGDPAYLIAIVEDITKQRRAQEDLRKSEERLKFALEAGGGVGTWDFDISGDRVYCDARFAELFSIDPQMAANGIPISTFLERVHPEDQERIEAAVQRAMRGNGDYAEEYRVVCGNGSVRWIQARGRCHRDENGNPSRFPGVVFDITERKEAEFAAAMRARIDGLAAEVGAALAQIPDLAEALQRSCEAMVRHLDAAFARIWTLGPTGDVLELQASAGLYVHLKGGHARVPVGSFKIGQIAQERKPHLTNNVLHDSYISDPEWARREGMVAFAGYPLIVEDRLVGVLGMFARRELSPETLAALDSVAISLAVGIERKRTEEELRRSNRELEEFAYVASHDLQEPLRMVNIYTQLLLQRAPMRDPRTQHYAAFIRQGVGRMEGLIGDLLAFSRTVHTEATPPGCAALESSLQEALAVMKSAIEASEARITVDPLPVVRGDAGPLTHVFQNLLSNALKYRRPEVPLEIRISAVQEGDCWVVSVSDNGIGFEQQYAARIFGLFKRLHKDEYPGTGLGLAICQRIIERFGGRMWAEGRPGEGATFLFSLRGVIDPKTT